MKRFLSNILHGYLMKYKHSVLIFLLALALGLITAFTTGQISLKREKERASQIAEIQAGKIQHVIEKLLFTANTFEVLLSEGDGQINNFTECAKDIVGTDQIRNFSIAPGGIITDTYPLKGNEAVIGHNLLQDPERKLEAEAALTSRVLTLAGPYTLRQGGFGVIGRLPVFLENPRGQNYFWGFVCVTLELPDALEGAQMAKLEDQQYAFELWRRSPDTKKKQVIMQSRKNLTHEPEEASLTLPNSTWFLSVAPASGWGDAAFLYFKIFLAFMFAALAALLSKNVLALAKSRNELSTSLLQQAENYKLLNSLNEELRLFRHDVNNHMISLFNLLEHEDLKGAKSYLTFMSETVSSVSQITNTENYVFDALMAKKISLAREKQIQVECEVYIGKQLMIENQDFSILFGNAMDNAIEACELAPANMRSIHIFVQYKGNFLQTRITNTMLPVTSQDRDFYHTTKKDPQNHGLGLKHMRVIVQKYHGVLETSYHEEKFTLSFLLFEV